MSDTNNLSNKGFDFKQEFKVLLCLTAAACIMGFNLKSFVRTGNLFPGGFSGLTVLIQRIAERFFGLAIPYSVIYMPLNLVPAYIGFKHISKKFTFYSFYVVFLSSIITDIMPEITITYDTLLISVFGGLINGVALSLCLISGASGGGTDFISIYYSERKGMDAWNYIFAANVMILTAAGILFGFDQALYSIIYQFTTTQVIQTFFKRYRKATLLIITDKPTEVYEKIREITHHDATLLEGHGCFENKKRQLLYSVVGRDQVNKVVSAIKAIDEKAFLNVIKTEQLSGRFYKRPY